ncbi:MAG: hypothetical protein HY259_14480 [Chloroflexi bacterium]|nr:hypothetical protein [Chloroflexota bacterium]MBI3734641.1 hypothetical protein [Chloroflexota bacterium]
MDRQALSVYVHNMFENEYHKLGPQGIADLLARGRQWKLGETLRAGGSIIFPHAGLKECGHQIAAVVQACLDSGADRVLAVGVLHALTDELQDARVRVANGADVTKEKYWGIQGPALSLSKGPGLAGHENWQTEFSMMNFMLLWDEERKERGGKAPELIVRYPYLAGGKPEILPGIGELQAIAKDAVVVSTADAFHHGIGYGDPPGEALYPEQGGLALARKRIDEGLELLRRGDYWGYNQHCVSAKSDARDAGQVVRYLLGPLEGRILDLTYSDTTDMYNTPPPTWVAAALIEQRRVG